MNRREKKICKECGKVFERYLSHYKQIFCSKKCRETHHNKNKKAFKRNCPICGKVFSEYPSKKTQHGCCSILCKNKFNKDKYEKKHSHVCDNCGKTFIRISSSKIYNFCSQDCSKEYMKMNNSPFFKKGYTRASPGYKMILIGPKKYKAEHRLIMEKSIGRTLKRDEVVHHINGNKFDNSINNLKIMDKREHDRLHTTIRHERSRNEKK